MPRFSQNTDNEEVVGPVTEIAEAIGEVYFIRKDAEDEQKSLREEFFEAITASFEDQDLARKTVEVPSDVTPDVAAAFAAKYNSGWRVVEVRDGDDDHYEVLIEEDPAFKGHVEIIELEPWEIPAPTKAKPDRTKKVYGYVVTKTIRSGSALLDDERMREVEPDLYESVTQFPAWIETVREYASKTAFEKIIKALDPKRELREDLTPEEFEQVKKYAYEGPKSVALNVRYADKDEGNVS